MASRRAGLTWIFQTSVGNIGITSDASIQLSVRSVIRLGAATALDEALRAVRCQKFYDVRRR